MGAFLVLTLAALWVAILLTCLGVRWAAAFLSGSAGLGPPPVDRSEGPLQILSPRFLWVWPVSIATAVTAIAGTALVLAGYRIEAEALQKLRAAAAHSDRLVIRCVVPGPGGKALGPVLFESPNGDAMRELADHMSMWSDPTVSLSTCRCRGDLSFELYRGDEVELTFTTHHFSHLRWGSPPQDHYLTRSSRRRFLSWLASNGIAEERVRLAQSELPAREAEARFREYLKEQQASAPRGENDR